MSKRNRETKNEVPVLGKALTEIKTAFVQMKELKGKLDAFIRGYRVASGIPDDWPLDTRKMAFVPPPAKSKKGTTDEG